MAGCKAEVIIACRERADGRSDVIRAATDRAVGRGRGGQAHLLACEALEVVQATQRAGTVDRVEAGVAEPLLGLVGHVDGDPTRLQTSVEAGELDVDDLREFLGGERLEHDDVVESIEEFRAER